MRPAPCFRSTSLFPHFPRVSFLQRGSDEILSTRHKYTTLHSPRIFLTTFPLPNFVYHSNSRNPDLSRLDTNISVNNKFLFKTVGRYRIDQ